MQPDVPPTPEAAQPALEQPPVPPKRRRPKKWLLISIAVASMVIFSAVIWRLFIYQQSAPPAAPEPVAIEEAPAPPPVAEKPTFDAVALQRVVDEWGTTAGGTYSVTIADEDGTVLAKANPAKTYFTASIYKLYVAYIGYQKVDDRIYQLDEPYLNGWTRGKCLDEMIRTSHSPCAEKMWAELGKENLTTALKKYGLKNTSMTDLTTSSADAAIILARLAKGTDLSQSSRSAMLDSMREQIYRDGLPAGFTALNVYDKVGFRELDEYHDTAIVRTKDGRYLVVSVLTSGVGTKKIAALGAQLQKSLNN